MYYSLKDFGNIQPYYGEPERYRSISKEEETEGLKEIIPLPDYKIEIPNQNLLKWLELIDKERNSSVTKKRLGDLVIKKNYTGK
jgi:hypothetical protein